MMGESVAVVAGHRERNGLWPPVYPSQPASPSPTASSGPVRRAAVKRAAARPAKGWAIVAGRFVADGAGRFHEEDLHHMIRVIRLSRSQRSPLATVAERGAGGWFRLAILLAVLVGLPVIAPAVIAAGVQSPPSTPGAGAICETGRLHVGDIPDLADPWRITVEADRSLAIEWRSDAVLVATEVSCGFLADEPRVRTGFYSPAAKGLWDPETAQVRPLDPGDPEPRELPADNVSFDVIERAMLGLGLKPTDEIGASGITIQLNTAGLPFGPSAIPPETTVVHLTVGEAGAARDVYIDAVTGDVYTFDQEARDGDPAVR